MHESDNKIFLRLKTLQLLLCCPPHGSYEWLAILNLIIGTAHNAELHNKPDDFKSLIRDYYHPLHLRNYPMMYDNAKLAESGQSYPKKFYDVRQYPAIFSVGSEKVE